MSLHQFPLLAADEPTITLWQVRLLLGRTEQSDRVFVAYVQSLVEECGFPKPFPSKKKGQPLTSLVTERSSFRRDAVEAWAADFGYLPPACAAALDAAAQASAAADMDHAAQNLGRPLHLIEGGRA